MPKPSDYWKKRFEALEDASNGYGIDAFKKIEPAFDQAQRQIQSEIEKWYGRVAANNEIDIVEARKFLSSSELKEFKWDVKEYIKYGRENNLNASWITELENASAKYHISRLEALKLRTQQAAEVAFGNELDAVDGMARKVFTEGYNHTIFEVQKGFNLGWEIGQIDERKLEKIISKPWAADGKHFSNRIWEQKAQLIDEMHNQLTRSVILGKAPDDAIKAISDKFNVSKNQAGRLVMTEQAYFHSVSQKEAFEELDVEEYEIVATLDSHTSAICQDLDGEHFPMKEYQPGSTAPPFHPWCRSVTVPYFEDNYTGKRAARGEDGKTYYVPDNMKYKDWKKSMIDGQTDDLTIIDNNGKMKGASKRDYQTELAQKFGKEHYNGMHDLIDSCENPSLQQVWDKYEGQIKVGDAAYNGHEHHSGGYIYVNGARDAKGSTWQAPYQVTFHESGHAIDYYARKIPQAEGFYGMHYSSAYKGGLFPETIKNEVNDMVSALDKQLKLEFKQHADDIEWLHNNGYIGDWKYDFYKQHGTWVGGKPKYSKSYAYGRIEKEIKSLPPMAKADLSDILEGATGGKISCGFGHGKSYWDKRRSGGVDYGLATEAFAEMIDSAMTNPESLETIKKYLPKSYDVFLKMIEDLL